MGLDQSKMGNVVAKQMEALEADYGDDCEIGDVCTIVEVLGPHGSQVIRPRQQLHGGHSLNDHGLRTGRRRSPAVPS